MLQPILLHSLVVEPRAIAAFPLDAADHAELGLAAARHVVAAFLELDGRAAVVAPLPPFLLRDLDELLRRVVPGADAAAVPAAVARRAHFRPAARAFAVFAARVGAAAAVDVDVRGLDPFAAATRGAVEAVFGGVFLVLLVPFHLEFQVEEPVDVFEGDVLVRDAAFGGHVLRVGEGEGEDAAEAGVAHPVRAGEEGGAGRGVRGEAGEAFDLFLRRRGSRFGDAEDGSEEAGGSLICFRR